MKRLTIALGCTLALVGCKTIDTESAPSARIVDPDDASRAALAQAVKTALGVDVTLADDALVHTSTLTIEHQAPRSMNAPPTDGRNMSTPILFRLVTDGKRCALVDERDDSWQLLANTRCIAEQ